MPKLYDDSGQELDLSNCPYYQGVGTCGSGCYSEPSCMTDEPLEGWPSRRQEAAEEAEEAPS